MSESNSWEQARELERERERLNKRIAEYWGRLGPHYRDSWERKGERERLNTQFGDCWERLDILFRDLAPAPQDLRLDCAWTPPTEPRNHVNSDGRIVVYAGGEAIWKITGSSNERLRPTWEELASLAGAKVADHFGQPDDYLQLWLRLLSPRFNYQQWPTGSAWSWPNLEDRTLHGSMHQACVASADLCIQFKMIIGLSGTPRKRGRPAGRRVDGDKIKKYRGEYSQEDFAAKCDVAVSTLQRAEHSHKADEPTLIKIARCVRDVRNIDCSPDDLLLK